MFDRGRSATRDALAQQWRAGEDRDPGTIFIVEDHEMLAQTLALALGAKGFECATADLGGPERIFEQAARIRPGVVLLDLDLGESDGLDVITGLRASGARVLVLTGCKNESRIAAALALGASGWVNKAQAFEQLLDAVQAAVDDRPLLRMDELEKLTTVGRARLESERDLKGRVARLTAREREVLVAMSEGKSVRQIADELIVSLATVRSHIRAILTKLGVSTQLAAVARTRQLVAPK